MRTSLRIMALSLATLAMIPAAHGFAQSRSNAQTEEIEGDHQKLICRRSVETGSLVKGRRECFTRAQWERIAESAQKGATDLVENSRGRPTGGQ